MELIMAFVIIITNLTMLIVLLFKLNQLSSKTDKSTYQFDNIKDLTKQANENILQNVKDIKTEIKETQDSNSKIIQDQLQNLEIKNEQKLDNIRTSLDDNIHKMITENGRKLNEIQNDVNEKLSETLSSSINKSFEVVSKQLEQVYTGIGEMRSIAGDVNGLKKCLSNVKTRGILGEIQLGSILKEILAPSQYDENINTKPKSDCRVEFAVKMPGCGSTVYLPIDSKFPCDTYMHLQEAYENGDKDMIKESKKSLETVILKEAKDISTKYIEVPFTTNFGIMFLPFEGLYAEVVSNEQLIQKLRTDFSVIVAGPSTMAALLNSLQMGFSTLAIQKRSNEVWNILSETRNEFDKFADVLDKVQTNLQKSNDDLDKLIGVRSRAITRKLNKAQEYLPNVETTEE